MTPTKTGANADFTIVCGLGNPGAKYAHTRHNIGWRLLDAFIAAEGLASVPAPRGARAECYRAGRLLALRPLTFMNASGEALGAAAGFFKGARVIVLHDEMELGFGRLRLQRAGSHAGHNGLKSIQQHLGQNYERIRLGIGRPGGAGGGAGGAGGGCAGGGAGGAGARLATTPAELSGRLGISGSGGGVSAGTVGGAARDGGANGGEIVLSAAARENISPADSPRAQQVLAWVLGEFSAAEEAALEGEFLPRALDALRCLLASDLATAQNHFNR